MIKISQYAFIVDLEINLNENNIYCIVYGFGNRTLDWNFIIESPKQASAQMGMMKPNMMNRTGMMGTMMNPNTMNNMMINPNMMMNPSIMGNMMMNPNMG